MHFLFNKETPQTKASGAPGTLEAPEALRVPNTGSGAPEGPQGLSTGSQGGPFGAPQRAQEGPQRGPHKASEGPHKNPQERLLETPETTRGPPRGGGGHHLGAPKASESSPYFGEDVDDKIENTGCVNEYNLLLECLDKTDK